MTLMSDDFRLEQAVAVVRQQSFHIAELNDELKRCADQLEENTDVMDKASARIKALEAALREIKDQYLTPDQSSAIARAVLT
jgi:chromosome segregation ATPase